MRALRRKFPPRITGSQRVHSRCSIPTAVTPGTAATLANSFLERTRHGAPRRDIAAPATDAQCEHRPAVRRGRPAAIAMKVRSSTFEPASSIERQRHFGATTSALPEDRLARSLRRGRGRPRASVREIAPRRCAGPARARRESLVSAETASAKTSTGRLSAISASSGIVPGGTRARIAGSPT